jgi:hypothetical protein
MTEETQTSESQSEETERKKSLRRSWKSSGPVAKLTVVFAGIAAAASLTYAFTSIWQLSVMSGQLTQMKLSGEQTERAVILNMGQLAIANRSAETAKQALDASSRAWIAPANAYFTSELSKNVPLSFEVQYRNTGRSPALDVHAIWDLQQVPVSKFEDNTFNAFIEADKPSDACKRLGTAPGADVAYPDQPDGYKLLFTNHLADWVNDGVLAGRTAVVLQMCFAYTTVGKVHHTSFCYFYRVGVSPPNKQMNICTAGNHAD